MSTNIGATIKLDGEKEFRRALSDIDAGLKTNKTEMTKLTAEYDKNDKSVEGLTKKNENLQKQITAQTDKVNKLKEALEVSRKEYGENDARTLKWQSSLNLAEANLIKMNKELDQNSIALDKASKGTKSLGDVISQTANFMGLQASPAVQNLSKKLDGVSASGASLILVLGGIVGALAKATISTAKWADELNTLSSKTGITVEKLQELKYAADFVDVSVETMTGSMTKLTKSMDDARKGSNDTSAAFRKLRVIVTDNNGQLKNSEEVFYATIDALKLVRNETERDALAMQLFGKSAKELNPLIEAGSAKLRELGIEAQNMGLIMSGESVEKFNQLNDVMEKFGKTSEGLKNSLALVLLPVLTTLFTAISSIPAPVLQTVVVLASVVTGIILAIKAIKEISSTASAVKGFFSTFDTAGKKTTLIIVGVVAALIALAAIIAVIMGKSDDLNRTISNVGNNVVDMQNQVQKPLTRLPGYARGTNNHRGGWAIVGEEGPELVRMPRGSQVFDNQTSNKMLGGNVYYVNVSADDLQQASDVVRLFENLSRSKKAGVVRG